MTIETFSAPKASMSTATNCWAPDRREQIARWTVGAVDPLANLKRHIEPSRIDEGVIRQIESVLFIRCVGQRTWMFGKNSVKIECDTNCGVHVVPPKSSQSQSRRSRWSSLMDY